jgi:hypothetical protein
MDALAEEGGVIGARTAIVFGPTSTVPVGTFLSHTFITHDPGALKFKVAVAVTG